VALDMDRQESMPAPEAHDACLIEGHFTRYLPQRIKRWIRFTLFPDKERLQGVFRAL
jgi:hypothetical protein